MELPIDIQQAITQAHEEMLEDSFHTLLPKQRVPIYTATEILEEPILTRFRTWLAILTARKVLPFWESERPRDDLAQRILEVTEGLLTGKLTKEETKSDRSFFYNAVGNADEFVEDGRARAALTAAYSALKAVFGYIPFSDFNPRQIEEGLPDEIIEGVWLDTASSAVLAYSGSAYNMDLLYEEGFALQNQDSEILSLLKQTPNEEFDPEIRKEFWDWWLLGAIPQAWDLAHRDAPK